MAIKIHSNHFTEKTIVLHSYFMHVANRKMAIKIPSNRCTENLFAHATAIEDHRTMIKEVITGLVVLEVGAVFKYTFGVS